LSGGTTGRTEMLRHLERELIGPALGHETSIDEMPTSRYSAAILYPVGTEFADEPTDFSGGDDDPVTQTAKYYPSACGLSFVLANPGRLALSIGAVTYSSDATADPVGEDEGADQGRWKRKPIDSAAPIEVDVQPGEREYPVLGGRARLVVRSRPAKGGTAVTLALVNTVHAKDLPQAAKRRGPSRAAVARNSLYEVRLAVCPPEAPLGYSSSDAGLLDHEDRELAFMYRRYPTYAVGHGAAAEWWTEDGRLWLGVTFLPQKLVPSVSFDTERTRALGETLDIAGLADSEDLAGLLQPLADAYEKWSREQDDELRVEGLGVGQLAVGERIIHRQRDAHRRIEEGIRLLARDAVAADAFRLANKVMLDQMRRPGAPQRPPERPRWRAFQLAFALMVLPSLVEPSHAERDVVDLLWFPSGGGKTEAYLFLSAFEIVRRRLANSGRDDGTVVLSRYTLRLLTTQQFQRAAAMACAAEMIRMEQRERLGSKRITIGLFLGGDHTPNTYAKAVDTWLPRWISGEAVLPTPECPWCGRPIVESREHHGIVAEDDHFLLRCLEESCPFSQPDGLPLQIVDQGIYAEHPSMVIATVDKLAWLPAWSRERAALLGGPGGVGPTLVLQDELHLLNGPLGTTAALYEIGIQGVIRAAGTTAKVIASTATIRRAAEQSLALFGRPLQLFPPNGIRPADSFFSEIDEDERTARVYVGVMTVGNSWQSTAVYALTALTEGVTLLEDEDQDPYWTSLVYTNSLDDHGRVATLVSDDVRARLRQLAKSEDAARRLPEISELRGAGDLSLLTEVLRRLGIPKGRPGALDCVVTTNLIQVGIDVQRLGLIVFVGQPKSTSEYIQASSRVGRAGDAPGLIVTLFNHARARDRSHYESFRSFHEALYRWVEPMSVTPFSTAALDRLLPAVFTALVRHAADPSWQADEAAGRFRSDVPAAKLAESLIRARADVADRDAVPQVITETARLAAEWDEAARVGTPPLVYNGGGNERRQLVKAFGEPKGLWNIQTSMRSVEEEVKVLIWDPTAPSRQHR
jgi:hypothetical protein